MENWTERIIARIRVNDFVDFERYVLNRTLNNDPYATYASLSEAVFFEAMWRAAYGTLRKQRPTGAAQAAPQQP